MRKGEKLENLTSEFTKFIEFLCSEYSRNWASMAADYETLGVYDEIVQFMGINSKQLWLDFACGTGNLISAVRKTSEPFIVGVDYNPHSLDLAAKRLQSEGHNVNASLDHLVKIYLSPFGFERIPLAKKGYAIKDEQIDLIMEDLRTLEILDEMLKGRKADVITFSFCGFSSTAYFEGNYRLDSHDLAYTSELYTSPEVARRNKEIGLLLRRAVFKQATRFLKDDGQLIYVDRVNKPAHNFADFYEIALGRLPLHHLESVSKNVSVGIRQPQNWYGTVRLSVHGSGDVPQEVYIVYSRFRK